MEETCEWYDVGCSLGWLIEELKLLIQSVFEFIFGAFAYVLESIPVPDFLTQLSGSSLQLPTSLLYWTDLFEFPFGMVALASALALRFTLRRIPLIG